MGAHQMPLYCAAGTAISPQISFGDLFNIGTGTAVHDGTFSFVTNSQFLVLNMLQPHWPQAILTPNNTTAQWFSPLGTDPTCGAIGTN